MGLVSLSEALRPAFKEGYAVGSFNIINSGFADGIVEVGKRRQSPLILSVAEVHLKYLDLEPIAAYLSDLASRTDIPLVIHLDHGVSTKVIQRAVSSGFSSVMIDASFMAFRENIERTREVVEMCRPLGVSVEAELGAVGGSEDGEEGGEADPTLFTDPKLVREFVSETEIDALAVAIGNVHGRYKGKPHLDFELLGNIREQAGIPLVLHGGSGIPEQDFRRAITLGISKVNVFTSMAQKAIASTRSRLQKLENQYDDYPELLSEVQHSIGQVVEEHIEIFGSAGRAKGWERQTV
jgi:fructose-bisphosphate aldolase class II